MRLQLTKVEVATNRGAIISLPLEPLIACVGRPGSGHDLIARALMILAAPTPESIQVLESLAFKGLVVEGATERPVTIGFRVARGERPGYRPTAPQNLGYQCIAKMDGDVPPELRDLIPPELRKVQAVYGPEDGIHPKDLPARLAHLRSNTRAGESRVVVTNSREFLNLLDANDVFVFHEGRSVRMSHRSRGRVDLPGDYWMDVGEEKIVNDPGSLLA